MACTRIWHKSGTNAPPSVTSKKANKHKGLLANNLTTTPARIRTWDLRIRNPLPKNGKPCNDSDLSSDDKGAYTPAYKEFQKTLPNQIPVLPQELADIVEAWPRLPDSIKSAILTLVKASEHVE